MPIPIQDGGPTGALRHIFRFTGRLVPRLDETISPVAVVADTSGELPPGVLPRAVAHRTQAAVAGELGGFRFEVPPGTLALVTKISLGSDTAAQIFRVAFGSQLVGPFGLAVSSWADGRLRGTNAFPSPRSPGARLASDTQVAGITAVYALTAGTPNQNMISHAVDWPVGGLAGAFDFLEIQGVTANDAMRVAIEWLEFANVVTTL